MGLFESLRKKKNESTKVIKSEVVGQLMQNNEFDDWWKSKEIDIPFLDNLSLTVTFMDFDPDNDTSFINEADQALTNFFKFNTEDRNSASERVYKTYIDFLEVIEFDEVDDALRRIKNQNEIWNFVYPTDIYVIRRPYKEQDIYVVLSCECKWEQEHGLQLVFKQGRELTRVSDQDGILSDDDA